MFGAWLFIQPSDKVPADRDFVFFVEMWCDEKEQKYFYKEKSKLCYKKSSLERFVKIWLLRKTQWRLYLQKEDKERFFCE